MTSPIRSKTTTAWLLAAFLAGASSTPADAFVLCARKSNGAAAPSEGAGVKVRSVCKDNEATLDAAALGLTTGLTSTIVRTGNQVSTNFAVSTAASCEPSEVATGGGVLATGTNGGVAVMRASRPQPDTAGSVPTAWRSTVQNLSDTGTITATAYVVCAAP
jgi:hypothetical protein